MMNPYVFIMLIIFVVGVIYSLICSLILKKKTYILLYTILGIVLFIFLSLISNNNIILIIFSILIVCFLCFVNYKMNFKILLKSSILIIMLLTIIITVFITLPNSYYTEIFDTEEDEEDFRQQIEKIVLMDDNYPFGENSDYITSLPDKTFTSNDYELYNDKIKLELNRYLEKHKGVLKLEIKGYGEDKLFEYQSSKYEKLKFFEGEEYQIFRRISAYSQQGIIRPYKIHMSGFSITQLVAQILGIIGLISVFIFACLFGELFKTYIQYAKSYDKAKYIINYLLHNKFRKESDIKEIEDIIHNKYLEFSRDNDWVKALKMAIESFGDLHNIAYETKANKLFYGSSIFITFITILAVLYIF